MLEMLNIEKSDIVKLWFNMFRFLREKYDCLSVPMFAFPSTIWR